MKPKVGKYAFVVEPFHCDFSNHLFMSSLCNDLLNVSDFHSEERGYGMSYLNKHSRTWVLSRLAVEMLSMPVAYDKIRIATWVESAFRYFTARNYAITCEDGNRVFGYARSIWAMIDTGSRQPVDILQINNGLIKEYVTTEEPCPIARPDRVAVGEKSELADKVSMRYHDIDVNGHVNSIKYIEHVLNAFPIEWYKKHPVKRLDIAYVAESHEGDELGLYMEQTGNAEFVVRMANTEQPNTDIVRCRVNFAKD